MAAGVGANVQVLRSLFVSLIQMGDSTAGGVCSTCSGDCKLFQVTAARVGVVGAPFEFDAAVFALQCCRILPSNSRCSLS